MIEAIVDSKIDRFKKDDLFYSLCDSFKIDKAAAFPFYFRLSVKSRIKHTLEMIDER